MVGLKEKHIQDLEREKGELLRKLLANNNLRLNLTDVAAPSSNSGRNFPAESSRKSSIHAELSESEQTIFQLTEKVTYFVITVKL